VGINIKRNFFGQHLWKKDNLMLEPGQIYPESSYLQDVIGYKMILPYYPGQQ